MYTCHLEWVSESRSVVSISFRPHGLYSLRNSLGQNIGVGRHSLPREYSQPRDWTQVSRDLPNPGIEPRSPALQADSLLSEPPGKPMLQCYKFYDLFIWVINCNRIETLSVFTIIYSQCQAQKLADRCSVNICWMHLMKLFSPILSLRPSSSTTFFRKPRWLAQLSLRSLVKHMMC